MMRTAITGSHTRLGRAVLEAFDDDGSFVALDAAGDPPWQDDPERLRSALIGVETVLHLAPLGAGRGDPLADLDGATRGTFVLINAALEAGVSRIVLGSSLDLFDRFPADWDVTERWRPRPAPRLDHLCPWLAELSARECTRIAALTVVCLRFGQVVSSDEIADQPADSRWLHLDDAVSGVRQALAYQRPGWSVFHIAAAGPRAKVRLGRASDHSFGYSPTHDLMAGAQSDQGDASAEIVPIGHNPLAPTAPVASRPIRRVVIFGAGGPMGAAVAEELATHYQLRLTDARPLAEIAAEGPQPNQNPGSPVPVVLGSPHEVLVVDVTNPDEVLAACKDMDAVINCSVIRVHPVNAFRVNTLGAYNVARAAAALGIRRVVQTGPQLITLLGEGDYSADYDIPADAPPRPGRHLYGHSKYLGQEILRVFADYYDLEVPVLLFSNLFVPGVGNMRPLYPFSISWRDTGRAIRRALEMPTLPSPYEVLHICADLPHGMVTNTKAKQVLDWTPLDDLAGTWAGQVVERTV